MKKAVEKDPPLTSKQTTKITFHTLQLLNQSTPINNDKKE